jgi:hypothetical protein
VLYDKYGRRITYPFSEGAESPTRAANTINPGFDINNVQYRCYQVAY